MYFENVDYKPCSMGLALDIMTDFSKNGLITKYVKNANNSIIPKFLVLILWLLTAYVCLLTRREILRAVLKRKTGTRG